MALEPNTTGDAPKVAATAFVHPMATLIGHVVVEDGVFVGPGAVLRADEPGPDGTVEPIVVGRGANVQDCVVVHALGGTSVKIGPGSSIAHAAVVHGPCTIGAHCFVGFNSTVYKSTLGDGVIVMHHALVEGAAVPAGRHVPSTGHVRSDADARHLQHATPDLIAFAQKVSQTNNHLAAGFLRVF